MNELRLKELLAVAKDARRRVSLYPLSKRADLGKRGMAAINGAKICRDRK